MRPSLDSASPCCCADSSVFVSVLTSRHGHGVSESLQRLDDDKFIFRRGASEHIRAVSEVVDLSFAEVTSVRVAQILRITRETSDSVGTALDQTDTLRNRHSREQVIA